MKCERCNSENLENAVFCSSCGEKLQENKAEEVIVENVEVASNQEEPIQEVIVERVEPSKEKEEKTSNDDTPVFNQVPSIVMIIIGFLCCGGPLGIIFPILSLVEGDKVKDYVSKQKISEAKVALKKSKMWLKVSYIAAGVMVVLAILWIIFMVIMSMINTNSYRYYY